MANQRSTDESPAPRRPRTTGDSARLPVRVALLLLGIFLGLLVLWWAWPLITGA
jgi:hypothetical protein